MVLELYFDMLSEPCRAVYLFLKAAEVPFEPKVVSLIKGEHYKPDYVKKNPWKKVPIIIDDGFILSESVAILRYIAVKYDVAEHWYPRNDVRKTAKIDEFLNWHHLSLRKPMLDILLNMLLSRVGLNAEYFPKTPLDDEKLKKAKEEYKAALDHIATYYIQDQDFIGGETISVADVIALCYFIPLEMINMQDLYASHPKISGYVKRVEERLQPHVEETSAVYRDMKKRYDEGRSFY